MGLMTQLSLDVAGGLVTPFALAPGAWVLPGFALPEEGALLRSLDEIVALAPPRHSKTPGGQTMSVAMTNAGPLGWVTDRQGYRYEPLDPLSGRPWPTLPSCISSLAERAAALAGYPAFRPDACLVNRYAIGAQMGLHRDEDERDLAQPIVSISLGLPARFQFGGLQRRDKVRRLILQHGDVLVFGGPSRLAYHGVAPLEAGHHERLGRMRFNLTLRRAR